MPQQGQRTRSGRWSDAHPGRWRKASTGRRGLDIPGMQKPDGQQEAATTKGEYECEKDVSSAGVGPPDALKGACPVRVRAGMKPTVERQQGASFDSHIKKLIDDVQCYQTVRELRWPDGVECPSCQSKEVIKRGFDDTEAARQRYECTDCHKSFDDLTG